MLCWYRWRMKEHPADRFVRVFRVPLMIMALLSAPITLFTYAWAMRLMADEVGIGWFLFICAFHVVTLIGFGCLVDSRQQPHQTQPRD